MARTTKRKESLQRRVEWVREYRRKGGPLLPRLEGSLIWNKEQQEAGYELFKAMQADGLYAQTTYWRDTLKGIGDACRVVREEEEVRKQK